jgi:tetratricopeptide (TPR) repeat protein
MIHFRRKVGVIMIVALLAFNVNSIFGCTIITMINGDRALIGNNEDWIDTRTKMWFYPATEQEYGRVCFGFERDFGFAQGGINDRGLFLDANGLAPTGWQPEPGKPVFEDNINDYILAHCATVSDVIEFFSTYSVFLGGGKFVFADAGGDSIIVEWAKGKDQIIKRTGSYQISTNFLTSKYKLAEITDTRYKIAEHTILKKKEVSIDVMRSILSATSQEWRIPTIYSYICDLKKLRVYVYNFHNFEDAYVFDLKEELKKGKKSYDIPELFGIKTAAAAAFAKKSTKLGNIELQKVMEEKGLEGALKWYSDVKDKHWKVHYYYFHEGLIDQLGLELLNDNNRKTAIDIYKFNTHVFPGSAQAWESLGDAYKKTGDKKLAFKSYEKSIKLNPENTKARTKLKQLETDK